MDAINEFEHHKFIADKGQNPLRVDKYLQNFVEFSFKSVIFAAIFIEFCRNCGKTQMIVKIRCILQNLGEIFEIF